MSAQEQRLGYSPDDADALALTFAHPVAARPTFYDRTMRDLAYMQRSEPAMCLTEYDVLAEDEE